MAGLSIFPIDTFMSSTRPAAPVIRELGRADYEPTFAAMRAFTDARTPDTQDELWIVEHPPVFTLGLGADRAHVLAPHDVHDGRREVFMRRPHHLDREVARVFDEGVGWRVHAGFLSEMYGKPTL